MKFNNYFKNKDYTTMILSFIVLLIFIVEEKISLINSIFLFSFLLLIYITVNLNTFFKRKRYFDRILKLLSELDQKYLITEIMIFNDTYEDRIYDYILSKCNKSMLEEIQKKRNEQREYKDFIEQWVHEIKTPLSNIKLLCDNNKNDVTIKILSEISKTENYVSQALFFARSDKVEKDFLIREINLNQCVAKVIVNNKQMFLQNKVSVNIDNCKDNVLADNKWIEFIVTQIMINSVQYRTDKDAKVEIYTEYEKNGIKLCISDNGCGISQADLPRVFEYGFTGNNGRKNIKSTGIGLYLCKKLCIKLGLDIYISSTIGEGTNVTIFFPIGTLIEMQE